MTPQLQMAIKLLQLSRIELLNTIRKELEENPTLEEEIHEVAVEESPDERPSLCARCWVARSATSSTEASQNLRAASSL